MSPKGLRRMPSSPVTTASNIASIPRWRSSFSVKRRGLLVTTPSARPAARIASRPSFTPGKSVAPRGDEALVVRLEHRDGALEIGSRPDLRYRTLHQRCTPRPMMRGGRFERNNGQAQRGKRLVQREAISSACRRACRRGRGSRHEWRGLRSHDSSIGQKKPLIERLFHA